jgi:transposase-like protein/IS1 family transposase
MICGECNKDARRFGKDRKGNQRYQCTSCKRTFVAAEVGPLEDMRLSMDKAIMILRLLVEGNSIRTIERVTDVGKKTILNLLELAGRKCEALLDEQIQKVPVKHVECDELWAFVGMKEKTKKRQGRDEDDTLGDAYCFVAMERTTKLVLCWHLGRRNAVDTRIFTEKLEQATFDHRFQVSTDGFAAYKDAMVYSLGGKYVDFAQVVKVFGRSGDDDHKYSPSEITGIQKFSIFGQPNMKAAGTSIIERQNLTVRMSMRRATRLTNAFSKKWENLRYAYALHYAHYNFCRIHQTLRVTPAMEAGVTNRVWEIRELLGA